MSIYLFVPSVWINNNKIVLICAQHLSSERVLLTPQVDNIRDLAVELINKSAKYDSIIEPRLAAFDRQWHDIGNTIAVR